MRLVTVIVWDDVVATRGWESFPGSVWKVTWSEWKFSFMGD